MIPRRGALRGGGSKPVPAPMISAKMSSPGLEEAPSRRCHQDCWRSFKGDKVTGLTRNLLQKSSSSWLRRTVGDWTTHLTLFSITIGEGATSKRQRTPLKPPLTFIWHCGTNFDALCPLKSSLSRSGSQLSLPPSSASVTWGFTIYTPTSPPTLFPRRRIRHSLLCIPTPLAPSRPQNLQACYHTLFLNTMTALSCSNPIGRRETVGNYR